MATHYSQAQCPKKLANLTRKMGKALIAGLKQYPDAHPVLCYRGMSGVASATALALWWAGTRLKGTESLPSMAYVRKEGEDSHGSPVEFEWRGGACDTNVVLIFVDDFISSGTTMKLTLKGVVEYKPWIRDYIVGVGRAQSNSGTFKWDKRHEYVTVNLTAEECIAL